LILLLVAPNGLHDARDDASGGQFPGIQICGMPVIVCPPRRVVDLVLGRRDHQLGQVVPLRFRDAADLLAIICEAAAQSAY